MNHLSLSHNALKVDWTRSIIIQLAISKLYNYTGNKPSRQFVKPVIFATAEPSSKGLLIINAFCRENCLTLGLDFVVVSKDEEVNKEKVRMFVYIQPMPNLIVRTFSNLQVMV